MKTNKLFKTALLLLLAVVGTTTAWADEVAVTVSNDAELKTAYETAYSSETPGTTVITMNAGSYTCAGMSYKQLQFPKVRSIVLQAADGANVTLTTKVVSDGGGEPAGSMTFKGLTIRSTSDQFILINYCGNIDHISFIDCDITGQEAARRYIINDDEAGRDGYTLNSISFDKCIIHDMGNGYYLLTLNHKVQNVSFTNSTIYNYNGDHFFHPNTPSDAVFTFVFNNNTLYKCGSDNRCSTLYINGQYTNESNSFTIKDNIFWDKYGTGEAHAFYSKAGNGTIIQKNNVFHTYTAEWNTGSYTKDYNNLDYTGGIPFYDAENHNFGIHPSHALATASTTGGVVGDPRWLIVALNEANTYTPIEKKQAVVELTRSITAGNWSTLCLPFAMTAEQIRNVFGDDTKVAELSSKSGDVLHFTSVDAMNANKPYLIKVNSGFTSATIENVTIEEGTPSTTVGDVEFVGSYNAETEIPASTGEYTYYFISDNKLYSTASSGTANKMRGTRAYFEVPIKVPIPAGARQMSFTVDEESGETTDISSVNRSEGIMQHEYFDLQGRKVAQPAKGLYIVNGKKVVIK